MLDRAPIRLRLAATYAALLVAALTVVLALSWWLIGRHLHRTLPAVYADQVLSALAGQYALAVAGAALGVLGLGWLAAGHALSPLRRIVSTARVISDDKLDARVKLSGPDDEVRELATAFDAMLDRVAGAVDAQRQFVANASHELRTPLTVLHAEAEVALDDPDVTREELREVVGGVVDTTRRMEDLLDGLLVLASSTRGVRRDDRVALDRVVRRAGAPVAIERCDPVAVRGDEVLLDRLVSNLVENAVRHGRRGTAGVALGKRGANAVLTVRNDGPVIPSGALVRLTEPFERLGRSRAQGTGLGLSIVRAVAEAHGGSVELAAPARGGLEVRVTLPAAVTGT